LGNDVIHCWCCTIGANARCM